MLSPNDDNFEAELRAMLRRTAEEVSADTKQQAAEDLDAIGEIPDESFDEHSEMLREAIGRRLWQYIACSPATVNLVRWHNRQGQPFRSREELGTWLFQLLQATKR